jgi:hypothetical protein
MQLLMLTLECPLTLLMIRDNYTIRATLKECSAMVMLGFSDISPLPESSFGGHSTSDPI